MLVRSILQRKGDWVATVEPIASVRDAVAMLDRHGIGALVVCAEQGAVTGVLSERDILRGLAVHGPTVVERPVAELMGPARTCVPDDKVDWLMAQMTEHRCRHMPVVVEGRLAGIVSIGDVVSHHVDELQLEARTLHEYIETGR